MNARSVLALSLALCAAGALAALAARAADSAPAPPAVVELDDVRFPHAMHVGDLGIDCATCHHETDAAALRIPHPQYFEDLWIDCGTCHRPGAPPATSMACSQCHHDSPTDIADETLSSKVVLHESCWSCHEVGRGAAASRACRTCHGGVKP